MLKLRARMLLFWVLSGILGRAQTVSGTDTAHKTSTQALANSLLERAQTEVERIKALVDQGILPQSRLDEANRALADAQDETILAQTLYGEPRIEDMTPEQSKQMVDAAERRVQRQRKVVEERQKLLDTGILARAEFAGYQDDLNSRERVLELANNRAKLVRDLREMAAREQQLEHAQNGNSLEGMMIRYGGNGSFNVNDLTTISNEFEKRFHRSLPVSALGQTLVHQSMGLDHRNRVDVALNPDGVEGVWLRRLLERLHIPYLGFRAANTGAATAPHIHIGPESARLNRHSVEQ